MSKSSKKLLIVGGCSHTDTNLKIYVENNITVWPSIVAKQLDVDLINLGKRGASNDYIANSVMDAVIDNHDREIIVMVLWTSPNRLNFFDLNEIVFSIDSDPLRKKYKFFQDRHQLMEGFKIFLDNTVENLFEFDQKILTYNLRAMWRLNDFLESRSIKLYQANANSAHGNIFRMHPILDDNKNLQIQREKKLIDSVPKNRYFSKKFYTTQSWTHNMSWVGDPKMVLANDGHPNQKCHNWLAEIFLIQTESNLTWDNGSNRVVNFIYD